MSNDILVVVEHLNGEVSDISYEMIAKAKEVAGALNGQTVALVMGSGIGDLAGSFASDSTMYVDDPALENFNPEAYAKVVQAVMEEKSPRVTMFGSTSVGMDLAACLSVRTEQACAAYVSDLQVDGGSLVATSNVYGGKLAAEAVPAGDSVIVLMTAGNAAADDGKGSTAADKVASPVGLDDIRTKFVKMVMPEGGDVDITQEDKLIAVGRGVGGDDGIELAQELADAMEAVVAASRPITDAGLLPKTRQVGKSGVSVKPKLYLMLGISGAPEHLEGMKDAELIIAINTDANAPIFNVAHYGTTEDLFDVVDEMLEILE